MDHQDLTDLVRKTPSQRQPILVPNHVVEVWGRWLMVKKPRQESSQAVAEPQLLDVPARQKVPYIDQVPHPPKWGEKYRMKPGPKSDRPKWCSDQTWATAQKRKQRGAKITASMLREIAAMQAAKAAQKAQR